MHLFEKYLEKYNFINETDKTLIDIREYMNRLDSDYELILRYNSADEDILNNDEISHVADNKYLCLVDGEYELVRNCLSLFDQNLIASHIMNGNWREFVIQFAKLNIICAYNSKMNSDYEKSTVKMLEDLLTRYNKDFNESFKGLKANTNPC